MDRRKKNADAHDGFMVEFYLKHKTYMFHLARKFGQSESECEDIVQDAMIRLLCNADSLRRLGPNQTDVYLYLTIRSVFSDRERKTQKRMSPTSDADLEFLLAGQNAGCDDDINAIWDTAILKKHLPEKDWKLLELKYIAGYSDQEIAREIHCVPDSVRTLIRRVRKKAKEILLSERMKESEG